MTSVKLSGKMGVYFSFGARRRSNILQSATEAANGRPSTRPDNDTQLLRWLALPALAALLWLIADTDLTLLPAQWWLWLLLAATVIFFARLNLADWFDGHDGAARDANGRYVTWSAALVLGPTALWLDLAPLLADLVIRRVRSGQTGPWPWWADRLAITLARDTLPGLVAVFAYRWWGGAFPPLNLSAAAWRLPAVAAVHVAVLLPILALMLAAIARNASWLERLPRLLTWTTAVFFFFLLPEPFAPIAAVLFGAVGAWAFFAFWISIGVVSVLAHLLSHKSQQAQHSAYAQRQLAALAHAILQEPADAIDLTGLLARYVPRLFPDAWIEVRLLPDSVLYAQGDGWVPAPETLWQQMSEENVHISAIPEAAAAGFGPRALLLPILNREAEITGGLYLSWPSGTGMEDNAATAKALAAHIEAGLNQMAQFDAALASQAAAYEEEVYSQAYQAEVFAQTLAYERMAQEMAVAGRIQTSFLPQSLPELTGWQIAVALEPARETSGDFYDFIPLPNGRFGLLVADVADKGMGAALYMALSRTLIRIYAAEHDASPAQALAAANERILTDTSSDLFVTVFYGVLDPAGGTLTYCNAGHNPPFLHADNGRANHKLSRTALPLGLFTDVPWEQETVQLNAGDVLVMYTDGVVEAEDETADYFGEARLQQVVQENLTRPADVIESKVVTAVYDFMGDADQHDDITLMILTREP